MAKDIPDYMRGFDLQDDWGMTPVSTVSEEPKVDPKLVENSNLEIAKVKECYDFEFRESKKDITVNIDSGLREKVMSLYFELNSLNLITK